MSFRLNKSDYKSLECIAEYRMLTVTQIAAIFHKSRQVVRRRLNNLEQAGLIEITGRELGRGRGRPENSLGLTELGVDILRDKGLLSKEIPYEKVCAECFFAPDHQLLLNWFRINLNLVEKVVDLPFRGLDFNSRLKQSCRSNELFYYLLAVLLLIRSRRS